MRIDQINARKIDEGKIARGRITWIKNCYLPDMISASVCFSSKMRQLIRTKKENWHWEAIGAEFFRWDQTHLCPIQWTIFSINGRVIIVCSRTPGELQRIASRHIILRAKLFLLFLLKCAVLINIDHSLLQNYRFVETEEEKSCNMHSAETRCVYSVRWKKKIPKGAH